MGWLDEVAGKKRFEFGRNWQNFAKSIDEERIGVAIKCLTDFTGISDLSGKTFIDVGCGSGLMSLAAYRLGAVVVSFDYDKNSVACTRWLQEKYCTDAENWKVLEGSVLDRDFLKGLGRFDVVYSWGVLHHTGHMWDAINNLDFLIKADSLVYIAIYNYQEHWSAIYTKLKQAYNAAGTGGKLFILFSYLMYTMGIAACFDILRLRNPVRRYREKKQQRGMSYFYDAVDWVGGYPFEVAKPEEIILFYTRKGFEFVNLKTVGGGLACNEYCFRRCSVAS